MNKKIQAKERKEEGGHSTSGLELGKSRDGKCSPAFLSADRAFSEVGSKGEGVSGLVSVEDSRGF
jgi:hypothetical protein